ncbi:MAG: restriction endonuclease [Steroidobacterales bacterium]
MAKQREAAEHSSGPIGQSSGKGAQVLSAAAADDLLAISGMSRQDVARLAVQAYQRQGYQLVEAGGSAAQSDAGIVLSKATQRLLLQCKYWKTRKIAEMPVRELYGMMAEHNANAGMLITSGSFTLEASRFAGYGCIQLIDGPRLLALLQDGEAADPSAASAARANAAAR